MLSCQPQASSTPATALSEARTGGATVVSCGQSGPQQAQDEDLQSYGANSPRAARSQISIAVSFEGAKPAGSAAVADCSVEEDSAFSVADPEGENSSMPAVQPAQNEQRFQEQPTTSLLSTAVRNVSPPPQQPGSPELQRASSVVSHTAASQRAARAGTPASVYAQGRVLPTPRARAASPEGSHAGEQNSVSGEAHHSARSSRRADVGRGGRQTRTADVQTSQSRPVAVAEAVASRQTSFLAPSGNGKTRIVAGQQQSPVAEINSIDAVQQGGSQDGLGGALTSAEGPPAGDRQRLSLALPRHGSSQLHSLQQLKEDASEHLHANKALHHMQAALKGMKATSSIRDGDAALLQGQNSAVLGSGLLVQQAPMHLLWPGLQTHRSSSSRAPQPGHEFLAPTGRGRIPDHKDTPAVANGGTQQGGQVPGARIEQTDLPKDDAFSNRKPQAAEWRGANMTRLPQAPVPSDGRREPPKSSPSRASKASHDAESLGKRSGESQDRLANGTPGNTHLENRVETGQLQPANSVLGTLINGDVVSAAANDNDTRSLQPSQPWPSSPPRAMTAAEEPEHSQHDSVLLAHSADGEPAMAVATDAAAMDLEPSEHLIARSSQQAASHQAVVEDAGLADDARTDAAISGKQAGLGTSRGRLAARTGRSRQQAQASNLAEGVSAAEHVPQLEPARRGEHGSPRQARGANGADERPPAQSTASACRPGGLASEAAERSLSGAAPATAVVRSEDEAPAGARPENVAQSQPPLHGELRPPGPRPALTIVMQGGLVGPSIGPDDGAAGPVGQHPSVASGSCLSEHSSANAKVSAITSPSRSEQGRPRREGAKRKRT